MNRPLFRLLGLAALLCCLQFQPALATTIDPLTWEQFAADADFMGIVECQTAGGIVAQYRVIESWKGAPAGTTISIRVAVNYWEPQFPIALVGMQYLVGAFKREAPLRLMSTTQGSPVPLWWRKLPAEYELPLFQGRVLLPLKAGKRELYALGSTHSDLKSFKEAVRQFLALSPDLRELRLLQRLADKYLFGDGRSSQDRTAEKIALRTSIQGASSPKAAVAQLLNFLKKAPQKRDYEVYPILGQGGGKTTLELADQPATELPAEIVKQIRRRLGLDQPESEDAERAAPAPPTEKELAEMRRSLANNPTDEEFYKVFDVMTRHDPDPIADYLVGWVNSGQSWRDTDYGYVLGSYFAWRCGKNRAEIFRKLQKAQDPFIRVAGAVYLCFENREEGLASLRALIHLPGDAGVWAALNLARRGDKSAVPRALEAFATDGPQNMAGVPHRNLQSRMLVLLSNSARQSSLSPSPLVTATVHHGEAPAGTDQPRKTYQSLVNWWEANQDQVTLYDPWLALLELQKVD